VAKGSRGTECLPLKDISQSSQTASPLPLCPKWRRRRRRTRRSFWESLPPRNIYFHPAPPQTPPNVFPSVVDLSAAVFQDEPFKKPKTGYLKPSFPFWRADDQQSVGFQAQSSQDYLSCPPTMPPTLSKEKREGIFTEKYEKLVVSRPEDSSYSCTLSSLKVLIFQRVS